MENFQSHHAISIFQQWKNLQSSISMFETSMANRVNELEAKESEIAETAKSVENSIKEVELRENSLDEKTKEVEIREKQMSEKFEGFEVKLQQFEFLCKSLKLKCRKSVEDMTIKEKKLDAVGKELDCRERKIDEKSQILQLKNKEIEERRKNLELRENEVLIMEIKAKESIDKMKIKECEFSRSCQALEAREKQMNERCKALDYREQQINKKCQGLELKTKELDGRCKQQELKEKELNMILQSQKLKAKQRKGIIQSLIAREERLLAVVYVCAFKMEEAFPPIPILKTHLECIQKRVQELVKKGTVKDLNDAVNMELSALDGVLNCISNFKLESSFSPAPLQLRIKELRDRQLSQLKEKEICRHDNVEELGDWDVHIKTFESKSKKTNECFQVQGWRKNEVHEPCRTLELKEKELIAPGSMEMESEPYNFVGMEQELRDKQLSELKEKESSGHNNAEELGESDVHIKTLESKKKKMNECFQVQGWRKNEVDGPWRTLELKEKKLRDTGGISRHDNAEELGEWDGHAKTLWLKKKQMTECSQVQGWRKNEVHEPWRALELREKKLSDTGGNSRHKNAEELGEWDVHVKTFGLKKKQMERFQVEGWRKNEAHVPCRTLELKERQNKMSRSGELWDSGTTQIACGIDSSSLENELQADEICRNMDADGLGLYIIEREKELKLLHGKHWQLCELKEKGVSGHDNAEETGEWDVHIKTLESKKKQNNKCFGIGRQYSAEELGAWDVHIKTLESQKKQMNECFGFGRQNSAKELGEWDEHIKALELKKKDMDKHSQVHGWRKNEAHEPVALLEANKGILCNNKKRRTR